MHAGGCITSASSARGALLLAAFLRRGAGGAAGAAAFGTEAKPVDGGFLVNGKKIFASLSGAADYYGVLCTERAEGERAKRRNTLYLAVALYAPSGRPVAWQRDPLGHAWHRLAHAFVLKDVFVPEQEIR